MSLNGPAGGLGYHARALRHRRRWRPFAHALAAWLDDWSPATSRLLLVGPSAGWCLPAEFLARFDTVDALEPDPLARALFRVRFRAIPVRWHATDYLSPVGGRFAAEPLHRLVRDFPDHAILFCNVLGQLPHLHPDAVETGSFALWKRELARVLAARTWASFHDRLSGPIAPRLDGASVTLPRALGNEDLVAGFYEPPARGAVELEDHGTGDLFPSHPRRLLVWEIAPGRFHLIEAAHDGRPHGSAR